jgi:hypothetical protein
MKKFSNITGQKVGEHSKIEDVKIDDEKILKLKILNLMDQFLSIRIYGPVDRYQRAGDIKIAGKDIFVEALIDLLNNKSLKDQSKLLESLKFDLKEWDIIDSKIEDINKKISKTSESTKFISHKNKLNDLYKKYKNDESLIMKMVDIMVDKITNPESAYLRAIAAETMSNNSNDYPKDIFNKISEKFHKRAIELGYSK